MSVTATFFGGPLDGEIIELESAPTFYDVPERRLKRWSPITGEPVFDDLTHRYGISSRTYGGDNDSVLLAVAYTLIPDGAHQ